MLSQSVEKMKLKEIELSPKHFLQQSLWSDMMVPIFFLSVKFRPKNHDGKSEIAVSGSGENTQGDCE